VRSKLHSIDLELQSVARCNFHTLYLLLVNSRSIEATIIAFMNQISRLPVSQSDLWDDKHWLFCEISCPSNQHIDVFGKHSSKNMVQAVMCTASAMQDSLSFKRLWFEYFTA
jgi:hypothetical protein